MAFTFGSGASGTGNGSSNLFAKASNPAQTSSPGLFGSSAAPAPSSLFGSANAATSQPAGMGLFGGGSTPAASPFGNNTTGASQGTTFGSANTSRAAAPSIFGSVNSSPVGGLFGQPAGNSAAPAPSPLSFGAGTGNSGGYNFGSNNAAPTAGVNTSKPVGSILNASTGATTPAKPDFNFGPSVSTTPAGNPPTNGATGKQPLFPGLGGGQSVGNLFGAKPADTAKPGGPNSLFSNPSSSGLGLGANTGSKPSSIFSTQNAQPAASTGASAATMTPSSAPTFSFSKPASNTPPNTQPAAGSAAPVGLFGQKPSGSTAHSNFGAASTTSKLSPLANPAAPTTSTNTSGSSALSLGGLFSPAPSSSAAPTSTPASSQGLFPSLGEMGGKGGNKSTSTTTSASGGLFSGLGGINSSTTPATKPDLFGSLGASKPEPTPSTSSGTAAPTTSSSTGGGNTTSSTSNTSGPAPPNGSSASGTNGQSGTTPNFGASTAGPMPQLTRLKNKTMDEIITRWASDLSKYQNEFKEQAIKVAAWDRLMVENGDKIQKLYLSTFEAERQATEIERQLSNVESQQDELASWLDRYEADVDDMFSRQVGQGETLQGPDQERERTYKLAEKLTERLDDMGKNLGGMIEAINDASTTLSKTSKADDPLSHIVRVLNSHLTQLQWIDENAMALQTKVAEAQKMNQSIGPNGYGGPDNDAAESFYRSFRSGR